MSRKERKVVLKKRRLKYKGTKGELNNLKGLLNQSPKPYRNNNY